MLDGHLAAAMLEQSPDCVKLLDHQGRLRYMSPNGQSLMEIEEFSEIEGSHWWTLWPEPSHDMLRDAVAAAKRGLGLSFEASCPTATGEMKPWRVKVSPVEGGVLDGMIVASSTDISEEIEMRETKARLEMENLALRHFTRIAAHDLRGPIRHHKILAEMIADLGEDALGSDVKDYAEEISKSATSLLTLLSDLEAYHVAAGFEPKAKTPLRLRDLVQSAVDVLGRSRVRLNLDRIEPDLHIEGNRAQLVSALQNVIENSIKYHPDPSNCDVEVRARQIGEYIEIALSDNGNGFVEAELGSVFAPLARQSNSRGKPGSGLGLSVVKQIVESHGGTVMAANTTGSAGGAEITIRLTPANTPAQEQAA